MSKTHLQDLEARYSAVESQRILFSKKSKSLREEIEVEKHRIKGLQVGMLVECRDGKAVITDLSEWTPKGQYLKKDGTPGAAERNIYSGYKVIGWYKEPGTT